MLNAQRAIQHTGAAAFASIAGRQAVRPPAHFIARSTLSRSQVRLRIGTVDTDDIFHTESPDTPVFS